MYTLKRTQRVKASLPEVWHFLQHPGNLDRITPPDLKFAIVSEVPEIMYNGLIVEYRITIPWTGTWAWVTELKHIREGHSFVDEQRLGPYRFWYHYHEIREDGDNTVLFDQVSYMPPFGILGKALHQFYIRRTLNRIFDYRQEKIRQIFGGA